MKLLFSKYRISDALDSARPLPPSVQRKQVNSDELRQFSASLAALDQSLKEALPQPEPPPALHALIMRAVRTAGSPDASARRISILRWLPAPAFALLLCVLWVAHFTASRSPSQSPFYRAATALETSADIARAAPGTALAPLTDEWERLNRDLDNTAQFLLATVP